MDFIHTTIKFFVFFFAILLSVKFIIAAIQYYLCNIHPGKFLKCPNQRSNELYLVIAIFLWSILYIM